MTILLKTSEVFRNFFKCFLWKTLNWKQTKLFNTFLVNNKSNNKHSIEILCKKPNVEWNEWIAYWMNRFIDWFVKNLSYNQSVCDISSALPFSHTFSSFQSSWKPFPFVAIKQFLNIYSKFESNPLFSLFFRLIFVLKYNFFCFPNSFLKQKLHSFCVEILNLVVIRRNTNICLSLCIICSQIMHFFHTFWATFVSKRMICF